MESEGLITEISQVLKREDGSEVKIVAKSCFNAGLAHSKDVYVLRRETSAHDWKLCSDIPQPGWREMSVEDYIKHGRSEQRQAVSPGEILKVANWLGKPIIQLPAQQVA